MDDFEWDQRKNAANIEKHRVSFETAARIFDGLTLETVDDRYVYGEPRIAALGLVETTVLYVVYTMRRDTCRIISARKANRHERRAYSKLFPQ